MLKYLLQAPPVQWYQILAVIITPLAGFSAIAIFVLKTRRFKLKDRAEVNRMEVDTDVALAKEINEYAKTIKEDLKNARNDLNDARKECDETKEELKEAKDKIFKLTIQNDRLEERNIQLTHQFEDAQDKLRDLESRNEQLLIKIQQYEKGRPGTPGG
jgi:chromosome segregation ATPase